MSATITPNEYVERMAEAIQRVTEEHGSRCIMELGWPNVVSLVGCLQLSLRHPSNRGLPAKMCRELIDHIYALFPPGNRDIVTLLKLGDCPENDVR